VAIETQSGRRKAFAPVILPGYPASHGCIRLPKEMAVHFFENADVGTPVTVREEKPPVMVPEPTSFSPYTKPFQPD
jgi:hypothetical protein